MTLATLGEDLLRAILQGTPPGAVYALIALGFVLTYKTSGVFNLAFGAQAYVSAALYFALHVDRGWPAFPAFVVSVVLFAPALGLVLERAIFRHLRSSSAVAKLVITIGLSLAIPNLFNLIAGPLLDFAPGVGQTPQGVAPDGASVFYDPFGVYALSRNELLAVVAATVSALALAAVFRWTAIGLRMRAVVESPRMVELNGIKADRVSAFAWALSSFFAGLAGVLIAPRFNTLAPQEFLNIVVVAIAAAAIGRLVSLPGALFGGLGLGILIALTDTFVPRWVDSAPWLAPLTDNVAPALPFIVLFGILVFWPAIRESREAADPMAGVEPPPPALAALDRSRTLTIATRASGVFFFAVVGFVLLAEGDSFWVLLVTQAVILSTIFLSITVITGMAGQISLCQGTFAAIGGFTVFQLVDRYDLSVLAGAAIGAVVAGVIAALLSIPVLRLGGIWVAIATLAFAYFFDAVLVRQSFVGGGDTSLLQGTRVPRPTLGPWDLADDKAFLVLAVVVFVVVAGAVTLVRGGTTGRTLAALRGSPLAAEAIGISPARARFVAFALSGFIAGLGGALLAIHEENVNYPKNFTPFATLFWLVLVVSLGSRTIEGAGNAGAAFALFDAIILKGALIGWILRSEDRIPEFFPISPDWRFVLFGLTAVQFARHPEGMVEAGKRRFGGGRTKAEAVT